MSDVLPHFYRLTDGNTQVFAAMGSIPASAPPQIQECVLQRLDTLQLSRCVLHQE